MLEGRSEQVTTAVATVVGNFFAYRRINRELWQYCRSLVRHNSVSKRGVLIALVEAFVYTIRTGESLGALASFTFYRLVHGSLPEGLVSEISYWRDLHKIWGGQSRMVSDVKTLTRKLLGSNSVPDVGYLVNKMWFDRDWNTTSVEELALTLEKVEIVVKRDYSERGKHVRFMLGADLPASEIALVGDYVVQRAIKQHPELDKLSSGPQVTLRLLTAFVGGSLEPRIVSALVKYDTEFRAHESLRIVVNPKNNRLHNFGIDRNWKIVPLSELNVNQEFAVPGIVEAKKLVIDLHSKFPHFQLVGWDLGVDQDSKPWIFEWNADHPGILFHQAWLGPVLGQAGFDLSERFRAKN